MRGLKAVAGSLHLIDSMLSPSAHVHGVTRVPLQENGTLQYSTVALTAGAAIVTLLRWLAELR
jgi:hypothetical protein